MRWPYLMAESNGDGGSGTAVADAPPGAESRDTVVQTAGQTGGLLDWRSRLPDNLRNADVVKQHPTSEAAAKTLVAQAEMIGRGLFLPTDAPDTPEYAEKMNKVYAKLGRPDTADKYTLPEIEGYALDKDMEKAFRVEAHAMGLSQAQVEKLIAYDARRLKEAGNKFAGMAQQSEIEGRQKLMAEFGVQTEETLAIARGFFDHFGKGAFGGKAGELAWQEIQDARLPDGSLLRNSPHLIAAFASAGRAIGEAEYRESQHYAPGQNTLDTLVATQKALTAKRFDGSITAAETADLFKLNQQILTARERANR